MLRTLLLWKGRNRWTLLSFPKHTNWLLRFKSAANSNFTAAASPNTRLSPSSSLDWWMTAPRRRGHIAPLCENSGAHCLTGGGHTTRHGRRTVGGLGDMSPSLLFEVEGTPFVVFYLVIWSRNENCGHRMSHFTAKMHLMRFRLYGSAPDPAWGAYPQRFPKHLAGFKGHTS